MTLDPVINQMVKQHSWKKRYSRNVATEYERFMILRNKNNNLSPSDDIDEFWHQHILNTSLYTEYCQEKFSGIVHHDPEDAFNQTKRKTRLRNTIKEYKKIYGKIPEGDVWIMKPLSKEIKKQPKVQSKYTRRKPSNRSCSRRRPSKRRDSRKC